MHNISRYQIQEKLGGGGMGVVYRAHDSRLDRVVALKFLPPHLSPDEETKSRFVQEAKAASALDHRNICRVHDIDETDEGRLFISMAYYPGETLKRKIQRGSLPLEEVLDYASQIAAGLNAAHEAGIVHRDVKPANIMITERGRVKIVDFGLAKAQDVSMTKTGTTLGTTAYMSPEQARGDDVDHRTDLWSLGVVMYEMLTGERPFRGDYPEAVIYSILNEEPKPILSLGGDLPDGLDAIIEKLLAKRPHDRYENAGELAADLTALGQGDERLRPTAPARRTRTYVVGGIAAMLLLVALALVLMPQSRSEDIRSLAVLPLENLTGDPAQEYFVEGMHDALTAELSEVSSLKVISRTSAMRYKDSDLSAPEISRELGVDGLIEGAVARDQNRVRITVHLIHGPRDEHLWTDTYERELRSVLTLQSEVARAIVGEIQISLSADEAGRLATARDVDPVAYEHYLRGLYHWNKFTPEGWRAAIDYFDQSIAADASYAPAFAMSSLAYALQGYYTRTPPAILHSRALAAAERAVALDSSLAEAQASLAFVKTVYDWDWKGADRASREAMELNPNSPMSLFTRAWFLSVVGRHDEAISVQQSAVQLDPIAPWANTWLGIFYFMSRRYDEAIEQVKSVLALEPGYSQAYLWLCYSHIMKGKYKEAKDAAEMVPLLEDRSWFRAWILALAERTAEARDVLDEISAKRRETPAEQYAQAIVLGELGASDQAFDMLERSYQGRAAHMSVLRVDPRLDTLRDDPRFRELLERMKFPENQPT